MANPHAREVRRFLRVALQYLGDAQLLFAHGSQTNGAVYLAGYAVECGLKALLLANIILAKQKQTVESFRGSKGHEIEWLKHQLVRNKVHIAREVADQLSRVSSWSVNLRYEAGGKGKKETENFLAAAKAVVQWAKGRL
jgi:HEPN domain-containing protein